MEYIDSFPWFRIMISHLSDGDFWDVVIFPEITRSHKQVHGREIHILDEATVWQSFSEKDWIYTKLGWYAIGALCADCPIIIIMWDNECAVIHSWWKGTKAHISLVWLTLFQTRKDDIKVYIWPHISSSSYEVQKDFLEYFPKEYFHEKNKKYFFDIQRCIMSDLVGYGIRMENIFMHWADTFVNRNFHSYRRDSTSARSIVAVERI